MRSNEFYWFMQQRERLRIRKEAGEPWPWTGDEILQKYKFTNVKRENDRTTKWMRKNFTGQHANLSNKEETLFNCAFFRYFGTMEFAQAAGWQAMHSFAKPSHRIKLKVLARDRMKRKERVFTGAYIITNQGLKKPKEEVVVDHFLLDFHKAAPSIIKVINETQSWEAAATAMRKIQGFGGSGFMTKEVLQDALHTPVFEKCMDLNTWCPVGPGARRGLNVLFNRPLKYRQKEELFLAEMKELYAQREQHWPEELCNLDLHDIQFQLCEWAKYTKVQTGVGKPRSLYRKDK